MQKFSFIIILALAAFGCKRNNCISVDGARIISSKKITPRQTVDLNMVATLTIDIDSTKTPAIEKIAQERLQRDIIIDDYDSAMNIYLDVCSKEYLPIDLNLDLPSIRKVNMLSGGTIKTRNLFNTDSLDFYINGLGDIDFSVNCDYINAEIRSSGNLFLNGFCQKAEFYTIGSGDVKAYNLQAEDVVVNTTSISVIEVYATRKLRVNFIKPGGQVKYRGNPEAILVTGVGQLIDDNL